MLFKKVLIANRGESAVRIIRACREMDIKTVAVYSDADRDALHTHLADEAYHVGGPRAQESYLNIQRIVQVARQSKAEAIHPGYGFLAENASFPEICEANEIVFIGPTTATMHAVGNKAAARQTAQAAGVPIIPGAVASLNNHAEAVTCVNGIGYPVLLKATFGGGGKGMRIVYTEDELRDTFKLVAGEVERAFGNGSLYMEKLIRPARHVEVQILADNYGNVIHLGERNCSIQRRFQKVLEESPSPGIEDDLRNRITQAAFKIAQVVGYRNAGTVEFLIDDNENFYFMEVNARLQVEHPVTELVTGIDIVKEQIRVAAGEGLRFRQDDIAFRGTALQCRIYAEDPYYNFMPSPGTISAMREPGGFGVRVDSGIMTGYEVPIYYDSLITKLIVWADTRSEAISRMKRALSEYEIVGIDTTIPFKRFLMENQVFLSGQYDTMSIEKILEEWRYSLLVK